MPNLERTPHVISTGAMEAYTALQLVGVPDSIATEFRSRASDINRAIRDVRSYVSISDLCCTAPTPTGYSVVQDAWDQNFYYSRETKPKQTKPLRLLKTKYKG